MPDSQHDQPLRGADAINDGELEVGFDERFEASWRWAELGGRVVMAAIVVAGLAGLFGRGPFSHRTSGTENGALSVDREPLVHYGTGTQVTLHIDPSKIPPEETGPGEGAQTWIVHLSNVFVEPMGMQMVTPVPVRQTANGAGVDLHIPLDPARHDDLVRLMLKPTQVGFQRLVARVGTEEVAWDQVVLP